MKTKIILLSLVAVALLSFTLNANTGKHTKSAPKAKTSETRVNKGLAMEDKNQFK